MTALLELGAFLGAIIAGFVADKWSRKFSIGMFRLIRDEGLDAYP